VDRVYESYLHAQGHAESEAEFRDYQSQDGGRNFYTTAYTPFKFNSDGSISGNDGSRHFTGKDSFSIGELGYSYSAVLRPRPNQSQTERPVWCRFVAEVNKLSRKSYALHVFVMPKGQEKTFKVKGPDSHLGHAEVFDSNDCYAGMGAFFGGKDDESCANCKTRQPVQVLVELNAALRKQKLRVRDAVLKVYVVNPTESGDDGWYDPQKYPFPEPKIMAPAFEGKLEGDRDDDDEDKDDFLVMQQYLAKLGYYKGDQDGDGTKDDYLAALKDFQTSYGLEATGKITKETVEKIVAVRFDPLADKAGVGAAVPNWVGEVTWWVGDSCPAYLGRGSDNPDLLAAARDAVVAEAAECFRKWNEALTGRIVFKMAGSKEAADVMLQFFMQHSGEVNHTGEDHVSEVEAGANYGLFKGDGVGGQLAAADKTFIFFDKMEQWTLVGQERVFGSYGFSEVCMHEIGHVIGLAHTP
jgi:hypothetical protein